MNQRRWRLSLVESVRKQVQGHQETTLENLGRLLWHEGIPNRFIELPSSWWNNNALMDAGLWIARSSTEPYRTFLVSQDPWPGKPPQVRPLTGTSSGALQPEQLDRVVLSLWPGAHDLSNLWRIPKRAIASRVVEACLWLALPLSLVIQPTVSIGLIVVLMLLRRARSDQQRILHASQRSLAALHHLLRLPLRSVLQMRQGLGQSVVNLQTKVGLELPEQLIGALLPLLVLLGSGLILTVQQAQTGLAVLLILLIWPLVHAGIGLRRLPLLLERQQQDSCADQRSLELLTITPTLRLSAAEERALDWWQQPLVQARRLQVRLDRLHSLRLLSAAVSADLCLFIARQAAWTSASLMLLGLAIVAAAQLSGRLHKLTALRAQSRVGSALLACPTEWQLDSQHPGILRGEVELEQVSFRYDEHLPWVLNQINLTLPVGGFTALVGPSGSGKSTLLQVLLGLETATQGRVLFDGRESRELQLDLLRPQIGAMLQNGRLVGDTLLDVLAAGRPLELDQALDVLDRVGFGPDLQSLPMGLETPLPDGGRQLSGGQRQKLALARALIGSPALLLLDEPTSSLDQHSQRQVLDGLLALKSTRLLIAHRLSTVERADRIVVMDQGRIVQIGTFRELRQTPGLFADLMQHQDG